MRAKSDLFSEVPQKVKYLIHLLTFSNLDVRYFWVVTSAYLLEQGFASRVSASY